MLSFAIIHVITKDQQDLTNAIVKHAFDQITPLIIFNIEKFKNNLVRDFDNFLFNTLSYMYINIKGTKLYVNITIVVIANK